MKTLADGARCRQALPEQGSSILHRQQTHQCQADDTNNYYTSVELMTKLQDKNTFTTSATVETTSTTETTSVEGGDAGLTSTETTTTRDATSVLAAQPASNPQETRRKNFQKEWMSAYPWVRYDRAKDHMFCHLCREVKHHNTMSIGTDNFRISTLSCHVSV